MSTVAPETERREAVENRERRGVFGRLYHGETAIDFYAMRWWGIVFSGVLVVVTVVSLFAQQLNLGIDFEGGVAWEAPAANLSTDEVRSILSDNGVDGDSAKIQVLGQNESMRVQVGELDQETQRAVQEDLAAAADVGVDDVSVNAVSASWGKTITRKAIRALVVFLIIVSAFISWRFEWRMAIASIAAMVHDVLISVGVYSVFRFEVTPATVTAFLTILGFSLYDTIVVFDKVKENTARYSGGRASYADITNISMNQVLMRSLNTNLAAMLPVLSLLVLGSGIMGAVALREFALALLIGVITGSYSSVFIATPVLTLLKERSGRFRAMRGQHAVGEELERMVLGGPPPSRHAGRARTAEAASDTAAAHTPVVEASPATVLTHAPRPRKKRRR